MRLVPETLAVFGQGLAYKVGPILSQPSVVAVAAVATAEFVAAVVTAASAVVVVAAASAVVVAVASAVVAAMA